MIKFFTKQISTAFLLAFLFAGVVSAQTSNTSIQAQLELIANLTKQINALQEQVKSLKQQQKTETKELIKMLRQGDSGDDVKTLQALMAADPDIYPEGLITGFFGPKTAKAVMKFQKKHGLSQVGHVGPKTAEKLRELLKIHPIAHEDSHEGKRVCAKVPPGHLIAPGWLQKHNGERPVVPPCQKLPPGIAKKYHGAGSTTPGTDKIPPSLFNVGASEVATTSAKVSWSTNEPASGKVYYGTASPLNLGTASSVASSSPTLHHSFLLKNLTASTTYYFVVESSDAKDNKATSSQQSFTTTQ